MKVAVVVVFLTAVVLGGAQLTMWHSPLVTGPNVATSRAWAGNAESAT